MARKNKVRAPVTLFAVIESDQHETLRLVAFKDRRSIADLVREAIAAYLKTRTEAHVNVKEVESAAVSG